MLSLIKINVSYDELFCKIGIDYALKTKFFGVTVPSEGNWAC
jgi:hypothetical protein